MDVDPADHTRHHAARLEKRQGLVVGQERRRRKGAQQGRRVERRNGNAACPADSQACNAACGGSPSGAFAAPAQSRSAWSQRPRTGPRSHRSTASSRSMVRGGNVAGRTRRAACGRVRAMVFLLAAGVSRTCRARRGTVGILPHGITPDGRRSPRRSSHASETTLDDGHDAPMRNRSSRPYTCRPTLPRAGATEVTSRHPAAPRRTPLHGDYLLSGRARGEAARSTAPGRLPAARARWEA